MNIYIGNLPYSASEAEIQKAFEEFGDVDSVKIIMDRYTNRSKGFGFVEMPNDEEANSAISKMNGADFQGRSLKVNEARPRTEGGPRGGGYRDGGGGGGGRDRY